MSKVLLLGGTGAMGVYLKDILIADGHDVVITSRRERTSQRGLRYILGDAKDDDFASNLLRKERPDAVVDFMIYSTRQFAARRDFLLDSCKHYLFLSSYRVFNDAPVITERSPRLLDSSNDTEYLKTDEYALCKARSEDLLRSSSMKNWTIVRPGITYSRTRFQLACLEANTVCYRALQGLPVVLPKEIADKRATLTWGHDVALMISRLILNEKAFGEDFNCTTSECVKWSDVARLYSEVLGANVVDCSLADYIGIGVSRAQVMYDRMYNRVLDNHKILEVSGLKQTCFVSPLVGLRKELEDFVVSPEYQYLNLELNARMDRLLKTRINMAGLSFKHRLCYYQARYPLVSFVARCCRKVLRGFL